MIRPALDALTSHGRSELAEANGQNRADVLTIALVNNASDAALQATERQFALLLSAASGNLLVRLKLYSAPGIQRSDSIQAHIASYYEDFDDLQHNPPDGIIVTGAEPRARSLQDESYWPSLSWLVDWVEALAIPSIWSCLAAHAAVLQMDGIERQARGAKLSGLFECQVASHKHHILHGLPNRWRVPHSRLYGLREKALLASGYSILSRSGEVGPDIFVRQGRALQLFFQGHPEYRGSTLLGEYRRDVSRFLDGARPTYPDMPRGCFSPGVASDFARFQRNVQESRRYNALAAFDALASDVSIQDCWSVLARRVYTNWLINVQDTQSHSPTYIQFARRTEERAQVAA